MTSLSTPRLERDGHEGGHNNHDSHDGHEGHEGHEGHDHSSHAEMFRRKFWLSLVLTVPVVLYSEMLHHLTGFTPPSFSGDRWVAPILGVAVLAYGGPVFFTGAWEELKSRRPGMMMLISLGLAVTFGASVATEFDLLDVDLWPELATLVTIMLLGHWMEMRALGQAQGALAALAELLPDEAERIVDGVARTVSLGDLDVGDVVLVRPGARVPADGEIVEGSAELDESMVTGESRPVSKSTGERVVAGTVSTDSSMQVRIDALGDDTTLAGIQRMVSDAQNSHSRAQGLADRVAALLFYAAVGSAIATFVVWVLLGQTHQAFVRTVTVLVIACPHALGLAIPLVISLSSSIAARSGILVKDRAALEQMRRIDSVLFDKTGTLTAGEHRVTEVVAAEGYDNDVVLSIAAATETESEHPLARAIITAAGDLDIPRASEFKSRSGRGVEAKLEDSTIAVGGPALLRESQLNEPDDLIRTIETWRDRGAAVLYVLRDDTVIGALSLEDRIRSESHQAVEELHRAGMKVALITGDAQQVADSVASDLGIDIVFAEVLPEDKDHKVSELQERGERVAMVGDGINDAPALARADVGIAIGAGTDVAMESAGVVLATSDPRAVMSVVHLSKASYRKMVQNVIWAAGYNVVAIPLAAGVFAFAGVELPPAVGAIVMSVSTIVVALNAQLLRRIDLRPSEGQTDRSNER